MKSIWQVIKATIIGGILFLVPVILLVIIIEKAFVLSQKITDPIIKHFPNRNIAGIGLKELIAIILLLLICFLAGLLASTKGAKKLVAKIENSILSHIPGYKFMKKTGEGMMGVESRDDLKVLLVKVDDAWQLAFLIEQVNNNLYTVFVPDAPSPWSGSVYHIDKEKVRFTDITQKQALACLRELGYGSISLLKGISDL